MTTTRRPFAVEQVDKRRVSRRRAVFFTLVFIFTSMAVWFMADLLWRGPADAVSVSVLILFAVLFAHIATGFCTALVGCYVINRGESARISRTIEGESLTTVPLGSTAVMACFCSLTTTFGAISTLT